MAYAKEFVQLTWGGKYFNDDIWVNGLHLIDIDNSNVTNFDYIMTEDILQRATTVITNTHGVSAGNSSKALVEWVKMAVIGRDGKYVGDPIIKDVTPMPGGRQESMYPQLATAVTLRSDKKRGPSAYGRYYAPVALPVDENGKVTETVAKAYAKLQANMIADLNGQIIGTLGFTNAVVGNVSKVGQGSQEPVTGVFVGNVVDTQRRRRNKLQETYVGFSLRDNLS